MSKFELDKGEFGDKAWLKHFLKAVEAFLGEIVETGQDSQGNQIIVPSLREPLARAWNGDEAFAGTSARNRFAEARRLVDATSIPQLREYGLTGSALAFKRAVLEHRADQYNLIGWKWYDKIIDLIDTLLKSLFKVAGVDDALEELKDFIWGASDDPEDGE